MKLKSVMKLMQYIKIKHLHEKDRWKNCTRFFCYDNRNVKLTSRIRILNCGVEFYLYQAFKIFMMFKMKLFQNDDYNVDNMKLNKIITLKLKCCFYLIDE
jgi:hypothetical protein